MISTAAAIVMIVIALACFSKVGLELWRAAGKAREMRARLF